VVLDAFTILQALLMLHPASFVKKVTASFFSTGLTIFFQSIVLLHGSQTETRLPIVCIRSILVPDL
jgi:hypothetical protein